MLSADPYYVQGLHNLDAVMVERGQLYQARPGLARVYLFQTPTEYFITKHLDIVMTKITEMQYGGPMTQHTNQFNCWNHLKYNAAFCESVGRTFQVSYVGLRGCSRHWPPMGLRISVEVVTKDP